MLLGVLVVAAVAGISTPAAADPGDPPEQSGVVTRFSEPGSMALLDEVTIDGTAMMVLAIFNIGTPVDICTGTPAGAGDLMMVDTPSFQRHVLLHDVVPVLLYDVTGVMATLDDFGAFLGAACSSDPIQPFAVGEAIVRNLVHFDLVANTVLHVFTASGDVSDGERTWNLSAHRRAEGSVPPAPDQIDDRLVLAERAG